MLDGDTQQLYGDFNECESFLKVPLPAEPGQLQQQCQAEAGNPKRAAPSAVLWGQSHRGPPQQTRHSLTSVLSV